MTTPATETTKTAEQRRADALRAARAARTALNFGDIPALHKATGKLREAGPGWQQLAATFARLEAEATDAMRKLSERIEAEARKQP